MGESNFKTKEKPKPSIIPAVEVEPSGCSFNPDPESHQDSLGRAVADEMQKVYRNELGPEPVPLTVPGEVVNEEDMFFLEADAGSDEEDPDVVKNGDMDTNQSLPDILEEIEKEDAEKQRRHLRRVVAKQERLKVCPPRLGKHKFDPAPAQVLLSEEITGSLRKLKGSCTLARDRFKSLEKRGLVIPSKKSGRK